MLQLNTREKEKERKIANHVVVKRRIDKQNPSSRDILA